MGIYAAAAAAAEKRRRKWLLEKLEKLGAINEKSAVPIEQVRDYWYDKQRIQSLVKEGKIRETSDGRYYVPCEDEEKEKLQEFAYDVGLELGREMGKGLEENWKSHVIAAVIAMSCGLLLISLNSVWYIVGLSTFISYGIAYYSLSKLSMKIKRGTKRK